MPVEKKIIHLKKLSQYLEMSVLHTSQKFFTVKNEVLIRVYIIDREEEEKKSKALVGWFVTTHPHYGSKELE